MFALTAASGSTWAVLVVTWLSVTVTFCASATPVRSTVMVFPTKLGLPRTLPVPPVTVALPLTTSSLNVKTSLWRPLVLRLSTPGAPLSGKAMSNVPAAPCVLRETADVSETPPPPLTT